MMINDKVHVDFRKWTLLERDVTHCSPLDQYAFGDVFVLSKNQGIKLYSRNIYGDDRKFEIALGNKWLLSNEKQFYAYSDGRYELVFDKKKMPTEQLLVYLKLQLVLESILKDSKFTKV